MSPVFINMMKYICIFFIQSMIASVLLIASISYAADLDARVIEIKQQEKPRYIEDYAKNKYHDAWDFSENDYEGIDYFNNKQYFNVTNKTLTISTRAITEFGWGDISGDKPDFGAESICSDWKNEWLPWAVKLKIKQSLSKSVWYIKTSYTKNGRNHINSQKSTIHGKNKQNVIVDMGSCRDTIKSIYFSTSTEGNKVEIESIEIVRPSLKQYLTREMFISNDNKKSVFSVISSGRFKLYINGKKVIDKGGRSPFQYRINRFSDNTSLRKGRNIIAIEQEMINYNYSNNKIYSHLYMQSTHYDIDGNQYHLVTNDDWKANSKYYDGWEKNLKISENWMYARDKGRLKDKQLDGTIKDNRGDYLSMPYQGRISMSLNDDLPVTYALVKTDVNIDVIGVKNHFSNILKYTLYNSHEDKLDNGQIKLAGDVDLKGKFEINVREAGAYQLRLDYYNNNKLIDTISHEFIAIGKIQQPLMSDNSLLTDETYSKLVFHKNISHNDLNTIDYGQMGKAHVHNSAFSVPSFYNNSGQGMIRTGSRRGAWFSVKYRINDKTKPHLVRVKSKKHKGYKDAFVIATVEDSEYKRLMNIGPHGLVVKSTVGVINEISSGKDVIVTDFLYWPGDDIGRLILINEGSSNDVPPNIVSVEFYEISELPENKRIWKNNALIGPFAERIDRSTAKYFYNGPRGDKFSYNLNDTNYEYFYTDWFYCIQNLIKYLKYTGQNAYFAGVYMYYASYFPSQSFQGHPESGLDYHGLGWSFDAIPLMAKMFRENDLNLILGIQFMGSPLLTSMNNVSNFEVANGRETNRLVSKYGEQVTGLQNEGYNYLHTDVESEIYNVAHEVALKYEKYPAIKGITWLRVPEYRVSKKDNDKLLPRDIGYGDITIKKFEAETDIKIPVDYSDRDRFNKRYLWLMKHKQDAWKKWRTESIYRVDKKIYHILSSKRQDWCLWRLSNRPVALEYEFYLNNNVDYWDIYKWQGLDPSLYSSNECINFVAMNDVVAQHNFVARGEKLKSIKGTQLWNSDMGISRNKIGGMFIRTAFTLENNIFLVDKGKKRKKATIVSSSAPLRWSNVLDRISILDLNKSPVFPIGWSDAGHFSGHESEIINVTRAVEKLQ